MSSSRTIDVAVAIIFRGERVLVTKRPMAAAAYGGYWEFPGGKVEVGESVPEALIRECREECGIDVVPTGLVERTMTTTPSATGVNTEVVLHFYLCQWRCGEVEHLGVDDHRWCLPGELSAYRFPPANESIMTRLSAGALEALPLEADRSAPRDTTP